MRGLHKASGKQNFVFHNLSKFAVDKFQHRSQPVMRNVLPIDYSLLYSKISTWLEKTSQLLLAIPISLTKVLCLQCICY